MSTRDLMKTAADEIDRMINGKAGPRNNGFVLLVFPFGGPEGARTNYVSNADRATMIVALKEIVARFEGRVLETEARQ